MVKHANGIYTSKETVNHGKTKIKEWAQRPDKRNNMAERLSQLLRPTREADADATAWARRKNINRKERVSLLNQPHAQRISMISTLALRASNCSMDRPPSGSTMKAEPTNL